MAREGGVEATMGPEGKIGDGKGEGEEESGYRFSGQSILLCFSHSSHLGDALGDRKKIPVPQ